MNAPDTIYIHEAHHNLEGFKRFVPTIAKPNGGSIPYDRRKTCVWTVKDGLAWNPHRGSGRSMVVGMYPEDYEVNPWCPQCGGCIEISDGGDKEEE